MEKVNSLEGKKLEKNGLLDGRGFVKVIKVGPETHPEGYTPEYIIAKAARVSYGSDNKSPKADKGLIEYLVRHKHTSPLEMCNITYCLKVPIAICRQLLRHRTGKFNEFSQRYSKVPEEDFRFKLSEFPEGFRGKSEINHQGSVDNLTLIQKQQISKVLEDMDKKHDEMYKLYQDLLDLGYAKELARFNLPLSTYSLIYVQFDLNNLIKFFQLRCAQDAQYEIRVYADAMKELAEQFFPICLNVNEQYKNGIYLGKYEKMMIRDCKIPDEVTSRSLRDSLEQLARELKIELID